MLSYQICKAHGSAAVHVTTAGPHIHYRKGGHNVYSRRVEVNIVSTTNWLRGQYPVRVQTDDADRE